MATHEQRDLPPGTAKRSARRFGGAFLIVSIIVHLLFALSATYFVVQTINARRKLTFQAGPKSPNPSQRAVEHAVSLAKKQNTMSAPAQPKRITTAGASKVALPDMPAMPQLDAFTPGKMAGVAGMAGTGLSSGTMGAAGAAGQTGGRTATMFGLKVKATRLGVILDVSKSTHPFLPTVLKAIHKNFANSDIVLVVGCGMFAYKKKAEISVEPLSEMLKRKQKEPDKTILVLDQFLKSKSNNMMEMPKRLAHQPNVFGVEGGGTGSTRHAFDKLIEQKVDSIYWFADFKDGVSDSVAAEVAQNIKTNHIKVYLHSFAGVAPKPILITMVEQSGGGLTVEEPKE